MTSSAEMELPSPDPDPRTRIAHIDVGYDPNHAARPEHILETLGRSFADGDDNPNTAEDPGRGEAFPDINPQTARALRDYFRPDIEALERLVQRDLSVWKK